MKSIKFDQSEIPIASLIDIVFLLIIFFVVTTEFDKEIIDDSISLAESFYVNPTTKRDPRTITINIKKIDDKRSAINIATIPLSLKKLSGILKKAYSDFGSDIPVVLRADGDIRYGEIDKIIEVITESGLHKVKLSSRDMGSH